MSQQLEITRKESQEYIDNYLKKYNGVKEYMDEQVKNAQNNGFVTTLFGRKRYIPELKSKNYMVREFGKRVAMNSPIQGTADVYKRQILSTHINDNIKYMSDYEYVFNDRKLELINE